ncbi:hypothetical protein [Sphingomonas sp. UYP23]
MKRLARLITYAPALAFWAITPALASDRRPLTMVGAQPGQLQAGDKVVVNPSTTAAASINLPHGVAPTAPVDGDCWTTIFGMSCRVNGVTIGPYGGTANANTWTGNADFPIASPSLAAGSYHMYHSMLMGGIDPAALYAAEQGGFASTDALTVGVKAVGGTVHQINAIAAYVDSYRGTRITPGGEVAVYGHAKCHVTGCNVWPINTLGVDTAGQTGQVLTNEFDFNINAADTTVNGMAVTLTSYIANTAGKNAVTVGATGPSKWDSAYITSDGAASYALYAGANALTNNSGSQTIGLKMRNSAGVPGEADIQAAANGDLLLNPGVANGNISLRNKSGPEYASFASGGSMLTNSLIVKNAGGTWLHQFDAGTTAANGLIFAANIAGFGPSISPMGTDSNIVLNLAGKGNGPVVLGSTLNLTAANSMRASFNIPAGASPAASVNGDVWATSAGIFTNRAGVAIGPFAGTANANTWTAQQFFGSGTASTNWLKTYAYGDNGAAVVGLNTGSGAGVTGAARTSTAAPGAIGLGGVFFGLADGTSTTANNDAWGSYHECRAYPSSTGFCEGAEIDATNFRATTAETFPYTPFQAGSVGGLRIASGGNCAASTGLCYNPATGAYDLEARDSDHALLVTTNSKRFKYAFGIGCGAVGTTDCAGNGSGDAFRLYGGLNFRWFAPGNTSLFALGVAPSTSLVGAMTWSNSGLGLQNAAGANLLQFYPGATDVNGITMRSGAAGSSPTIAAQGTDTNVGLNLGTKGAGTLTVNGVSAVSCAAGSVTLASLVVTNGLVTHC